MTGESWRSDADYAYFDNLSPAGLGWECLRRDRSYRAAYERAVVQGGWDKAGGEPLAWGLLTFADPSRTALEQPIFWRPELDPATVIIAAAPPSIGATAARFEPDRWPGELHQLVRGGELHLLLRCGDEEHRLWAPATLQTGDPIAFLAPADQNLGARFAAGMRFLRCIKGAPGPKNQRISGQKRRRLRLSLRALDGKQAGASYRALAEVFFSAGRIAAAPWKDSSLRDTTIRLVRAGDALTQGRYRKLMEMRVPA